MVLAMWPWPEVLRCRVEFQNKFYMGDGYKFIAFSYEHLFSEEGDGEE